MLGYQRQSVYVVYFLLFGLSWISYWFYIPSSVFSNKRNPLNDIFVKQGFGWTFVPLLLLHLLNGKRLKQNLLRWWILALYWCLWTQPLFQRSIFHTIEHYTGSCDLKSESRSDCLQSGGTWSAFDISGHTFLLSMNVLVSIEEIRLFQHRKMESWTDVIKLVLELLVSALVFLWTLMFGVTCLYFHDFGERLVGTLLSTLIWYLVYVRFRSVFV
ncbi:fat storage-inducing transmembrane protein 2 [Gorgonomyces haynaldii]|nr:fat storage-inducing transmembrane protein 2 [Gorgonomyces haynaldii]